ncbi:MAG: TrbC/VirB2 family protein [Candidatus Gracilibacteria bacterium]|nr:TrbC/VirB2 family protein [Candidatus Gracilibacteria bacterium]
MKTLLKIILLIGLVSTFLYGVVGASLDDYIKIDNDELQICSGKDECGLVPGVEKIENIDGIVTKEKASDYIQNVVVYLLGFVALIAVLYIIYAGFNILIGNGEEEKLSQSKKTILYVVLGMLIIFLAYPIVKFIFGVFDGAVTEGTEQVENI